MALLLLLFLFLSGKCFAIAVGGLFLKYLPLPYKLVLYLVSISATSEGLGYYIGVKLHQPNFWLFNCYILIEAWLLGAAAVFLVSNKKTKLLFVLLLIINSAVWGINISLNSFQVFANLSMICGSVVLTLLYFIVLLQNSIFSRSNMLSQPIFWLSVSTMLYFGCNIPFMGLHNYLIKNSPSTASKLMTINDILDILRYPLTAISFILLGRQRKAEVKQARTA